MSHQPQKPTNRRSFQDGGQGNQPQVEGTSTGQQAQGTSTERQAQGTSTKQHQAQGTSTEQQAQGTSSGQQQAQGTSTGQQQAQCISTGQQQVQSTSTEQQVQDTSTRQQVQGTSMGQQQAHGTSPGRQSQGTRTRQQQALGTSTEQQVKSTITGQKVECTITRQKQAQGTSTGQQVQSTGTGQAQGTSTGQQVQDTTTGQQVQSISTGQQVQGTSTGQQQAHDTSPGRKAQGTRTRQQQAQCTRTGHPQSQSTCTGQQQALGTSTGEQTQCTSTGQQQTQCTSTGQQQTQCTCTGQQQTQCTSTGQQAQGTSTGQQAQGTSTGQQAQGTSTGQKQAQGTSSGQVQGTSTGQQAQGTSTGQQEAQGTRTRQQQTQGISTGQQTQCTSTGQQQAQDTRTKQQQAQGISNGQQAQCTSTGRQQALGTSTRQQAQSISTGQQALVAAAEASWLQSVRHWYPNLHGKTYFLPPIHANQVSYDVQTVAGQSVLVPQKASDQPGQAPAYFPPTGPPPHPSGPPLAAGIWPLCQVVPTGLLPVVQDSDTRNDHATQRVRNYIRDLAEREQEVMLVLFQLEFRKYLDKQVDPITAAAICLLRRPATPSRIFADGDFDVLMINARYGLIVGEIKSVGADLSKTPDLDKAVVKAVEKAIKQLNKEEGLMKHLVSDMARINITKTLILPNVTSTQLLNALSTNAQVEKALCRCVGVGTDPAAAVARCLCSDTIETSDWWARAITDNGPDPSMTPDLYERLVARFCGPATTVEIPTVTTPRRAVELRTQSEAVALTGLTLSMLTLYPDQVELVDRPGQPRVFLWGPPGTGKTVVLIIKGLQWGHQGKDVHLVSSHRDSRSAILLIERQLQHSLGIGSTSTPTPASTSAPGPRVYTHFYNFSNESDVGDAVGKLASAACDGELFVIADEAFSGSVDSEDGGVDTSGRFAAFCTHLAARVPALHLWAAAVERVVTPACLREERVTTPVRCPPAVLRQVQESELIDDVRVPRYSSSAAPAPTDGPAVREIRHWEGRGWSPTRSPGHTEDLPEDCKGCADHIAHLIDELRVGQPGCDLQYRDTIILCGVPRDDLPVVTRLRARSVPMQVVTSHDDEAAIRDVAVAVRDAVTVTDYNVVSGLERRVVVVMGWGGVVSAGDYRERLGAMSRCTSLLVWAGGPL